MVRLWPLSGPRVDEPPLAGHGSGLQADPRVTALRSALLLGRFFDAAGDVPLLGNGQQVVDEPV
ncbi:MAG: hypothetical protein ABR558_08710, partial [Thioalkalivibrio sp.]